ncbi:MAG TPA: hypothetical protein VMV27_03310 [Candidatus Binataceae bacterium]|nr:hypothetical protein [Candidatus Binataceae bacterium]
MVTGTAAETLTWQERLRRMGESLLSPKMNNRQEAAEALLVLLLADRDLQNEIALPLWKSTCHRIIGEIVRSHNQTITNRSFVAPDTWARARRQDRALRALRMNLLGRL